MTDRPELAERLIGDIDAVEAKRNLAVYERDARLVARWFLAQGRVIEAQREALAAAPPPEHVTRSRVGTRSYKRWYDNFRMPALALAAGESSGSVSTDA